MKANQALVDLVATIGKRKQATPERIALAWLRAQKMPSPRRGSDRYCRS